MSLTAHAFHSRSDIMHSPLIKAQADYLVPPNHATQGKRTLVVVGTKVICIIILPSGLQILILDRLH